MRNRIDEEVQYNSYFLAKSIGENKRVPKKHKINKVKFLTFVIVSSSMIFSSTVLLKTGISAFQDQKYLHDVTFENSQEFNANAGRNTTVNESVVYYKNDENAKTIKNNLTQKGLYTENDIHIEIYKMYALMRSSPARRELNNMTELLGHLKLLYAGNEMFEKIPNDFSDYLRFYGFVEEDGITVDPKSYVRQMQKELLKLRDIEEIESVVLSFDEKIPEGTSVR